MKCIYTLCLLAILAGCNKNPPPTPAPDPYQYFTTPFVTHIQANRLFCRSGEITAPATVAAYNQMLDQYFYKPGSAFTDPAYTSFSWVSADSIINTGTTPAYPMKRISQGEYDKYAGPWVTPVNDTNALFLHLAKYPMHTVLYPANGTAYAAFEQPSRVMKRVADTLFLPMMRYVVISRHNGLFSFGTELQNNVLNTAGISKLGANDTMLLQSFDLGLLRRK